MPERLSPRESLLASRFDLVMVMGSPFDLDSDGKVHYPLFKPSDGDLNRDGDLKAQAIQQLYLNKITPKVLVTGGMQNGTSRAETLVRHANMQYGVPLEFMIPLTSRPHSIGNLEKTIKYLEENALLPEKLGILTISAHIRRSAEMAEKLGLNQKLARKPQYISAEVILQEAGKLTLEATKEFYQSPSMIKRIQDEESGVIALRNNSYVPRS